MIKRMYHTIEEAERATQDPAEPTEEDSIDMREIMTDTRYASH